MTATAQNYAVDITSYVNYIRSIGRKEITLVLVEREQQKDGGISQFHAKENASGHAPFLYLEGGGAAFKSVNSTARPANATYYVDAVGGNDRADGKSVASAWKTLKKVESVFLLAGDQVLFKKGGRF